jgi:hypothetical protein
MRVMGVGLPEMKGKTAAMGGPLNGKLRRNLLANCTMFLLV